MSKVQQAAPRLNTFIFLSICIFTFLLHNYVNDCGYSIVQTESHSLDETRVEPVHTDHDTHDDDLVSPDEISSHTQADIAALKHDGWLSYLSHLPDPLLPPPKVI
jgi:hypothetical protein